MQRIVSYIASHGFHAWVSGDCVKAVMIGNTREGYPVSFIPETIRTIKDARNFLGY